MNGTVGILGDAFVSRTANVNGTALARLHPEAPRGVMILDVPIPGLEPWEQVKADPVLITVGEARPL